MRAVQNPRRVVVTGIGAVTPVGVGRQEFWQGLLDGRCGTGPVCSFDTSPYAADQGAEIQNFEGARFVRRLDLETLGRTSQLAIAAVRLALEDAGVDPLGLDPDRCGVAMGTTSGEPREMERFDDRFMDDQLDRVGPRFMSRYPCHVIAGHVAREFDFAGPNLMLPAACAAGNYAVSGAFDLLRSGRADLMVAGGADCFSRITYAGFARLGAIAPERCQPFDRNRKGMIPGEGAAALILEPLERALERNATVFAEVLGYGLSCDAHHMTAAHPRGDGAARAMERALRESGFTPEQVSYVSAHGTGTPTNDRLEGYAVARVFGEAARRIPMSSVKSMLGHTMGAASAIEAAVCCLTVHDGHVPPTIHFEEADPDCDFDCVPNQAREVPVELAMNNAYAFGGANASVLFGQCRP